MDPGVKAQWVTALRSGEYKQGRGTLHSIEPDGSGMPDTYCCLGVLCELAVKAGVIPPSVPQGSRSAYDGMTGILSASVQSWAGFTVGRGDPYVTEEGTAVRLSYVNDGELASFETIARLIEESL